MNECVLCVCTVINMLFKPCENHRPSYALRTASIEATGYGSARGARIRAFISLRFTHEY